MATVGFPLYDAHGNMTGCIFRGNAGTYSVQNRRSYDAWGLVRQGSGSGDPKGRYCANLGHKVDDESGLIYMRARYYDPGSGRFVSEDASRDGINWFAYARNIPTEFHDQSGKAISAIVAVFALLAELIFAFVAVFLLGVSWIIVAIIGVLLAICVIADALGTVDNMVKAFMKAIKPHMNQYDRALHDAMSLINEIKTDGDVAEKLLACDLEDFLYLEDAENS